MTTLPNGEPLPAFLEITADPPRARYACECLARGALSKTGCCGECPVALEPCESHEAAPDTVRAMLRTVAAEAIAVARLDLLADIPQEIPSRRPMGQGATWER